MYRSPKYPIENHLSAFPLLSSSRLSENCRRGYTRWQSCSVKVTFDMFSFFYFITLDGPKKEAKPVLDDEILLNRASAPAV
jgi:hypothetical protein